MLIEQDIQAGLDRFRRGFDNGGTALFEQGFVELTDIVSKALAKGPKVILVGLRKI